MPIEVKQNAQTITLLGNLRSGPTLRQFIIAAVAQGCRERFSRGEIVGWKGPLKAHYLVRPKETGDIVAVLPAIRDSDSLAPTVLAHLCRVLDVTGFEDEIGAAD